MADLKLWVQEHYLPLVLVAASPAAEAIATSKNGLSVADMLRPYSSVPLLNVAMRVGELVWTVPDMRMRFHAVGTAFQTKPEVYEAHLQEVLQAAALRYAKMEAQPGLLDTDGGAPAEELTPWFTEYREEFLRVLRWSDHEALDHPVACVYVVPCDAPNAVSHFQTLEGTLPSLPLVTAEAMPPIKDRDLPKHYVLLRDGSEDVDERKVQDNLTAVRRMFGEQHCSLLKINTARGDKQGAAAPAEFFRRFQRTCLTGGGAGEPDVRPHTPSQGHGAYLSNADLDGLAALVRDICTLTLMPRLEERVARLNAAVTTSRRGLRNRLTRFWKPAIGGGGTAAAADTAAATSTGNENLPYPHHMIESQMRQLADLAFMLRQYAFAESVYRLAAQDYQTNGNNKWYAGAEEMIGLCCVMDTSEGNDPLKYFGRAYDHYVKMSSKAGRVLATRSMLLCAAYQRSVGRHLATSHVLMRAHFEEENARAALLLEQAAYALLSLQPPSTRKFAFQMVLAGLRYHSCGQKRLAINAYRQVMAVYHGKHWRSIEEHLNDVLGKQCREVGDTQRALWHFQNLLECGHRPPGMQQHYLQQFMEAVHRTKGAAHTTSKDTSHLVLDNLEVPLVDRADVRISFADQACRGNPAAQVVPEATWKRLEVALAAGDAAGGGNWLEGTKNLRDHEEYNLCVAAEDISVDIRIRNPLAVKLRLSAVRLVCEFTPLDAAAATAGGSDAAASEPFAVSDPGPKPVLHVSSATQLAAAAALASSSLGAMGLQPQAVAAGPLEIADSDAAHPLADERPPWQRSEQLFIQDDRFTLHGGEVLMEQLHVRPLVPGWLRITGVQWTLNDAVEGRVTFDVKGRHRKHPKGPRLGQRKHFPPSRRLLFSVVAAMPRLQLVSDDIPQQMYQGELYRAVVTLTNAGTLPLRNLQLVLGHPEVACPANMTRTQRSLFEALQDPEESIVVERLPKVCDGQRDLQLVRAWPGRELQPGERLEWPLWLHPRGVGLLNFHCVWYCEPSVPVPAMKWRTLRSSYEVQVTPLLSLRSAVGTTAQDLYAFQLRLAVENKDPDSSVLLRQMTCLSRGEDAGWRIRHASAADGATGPPSTSSSSPPAYSRASSMGSPQTTTAAALAPLSTHTLMPGIGLQAGEAHVGHFQLVPPHGANTRGQAGDASPPLSTSGRQSSEQGGRIDSGTVVARRSAPPPGVLDFEADGVLSWFYGGPRRQQQRAGQGPLGGRSEAAPSNRNAPPSSASGPIAAAAPPSPPPPPGAMAPGEPPLTPSRVPLADPPVDVLVAWRVMDGAGPTAGRERLGVCRVRDICSMIQVPPIRVVLLGPSVVRHDFRLGAACIVPLCLAVRNCCGLEAKLQIETGEPWQTSEVQNAWTVSLSSVASPPSYPGQPGTQPPMPPPITYQAGLAPSSEYVWCGKTYVNIPGLAPGEAAQVALQVAVFRPGMYSVTGCRCTYILESPSVIDTQRAEPLMIRIEAV